MLFFFGGGMGGSIFVGGEAKKFGGEHENFFMQILHSFPSNKPKKPEKFSACGGQTMKGRISRLVILITFFT